jgi:Ankyrin repeats (3 copies)
LSLGTVLPSGATGVLLAPPGFRLAIEERQQHEPPPGGDVGRLVKQRAGEHHRPARVGAVSVRAVLGEAKVPALVPFAPQRLRTPPRACYDQVVKVLLDGGANVNAATIPGVRTEAFTHSNTRGETPLHRAAAFGSVHVIQMLLAKDANGETPLMWASWYRRAGDVLDKLLPR